jgi:glycine oxidase
MVVDRSEPGREASHAAAGMLACHDPELREALRPLALASAKIYPEFIHELEDESGTRVDYRHQGTILLTAESGHPHVVSDEILTVDDLREIEPRLVAAKMCARLLDEASVDPRALVAALLKAAKHRGIEVAQGQAVEEVRVAGEGVIGVRTSKTHFAAPVVVNCAGAWAEQIGPLRFPVRPVKGQMLAVVSADHNLLRHVVRAPEVYMVPRTDGRIIIGATVEETGFDKRVEPDVVHRFHQAAANLVPDMGEAKMHEVWAGLRPGTPDDLPILGATETQGYYVALGHFRNGILLTPITAQIMSDMVRGMKPGFDLSAFSPARFQAGR